LILMNIDFGPMKQHETEALAGNLRKLQEKHQIQSIESASNEDSTSQAKLIDLLLPIFSLIVLSVFALVYVGGFFEAGGDYYHDFIGAFGNTDSTVALPMGSLAALILIMAYLLARKRISFTSAMESIGKGFTSMVPAILILTMATSLKNMTGLLESDLFVKNALANAGALTSFLPAIFFLVACGIAFATGTSWGTFGILIPIVLSVFSSGSELMIIGMSACLAGSVCGDHCSPISDTTIMSSAGAQCDHVEHVSTQLPYALTVAAISFVTYLFTAFVQNWMIALPFGIVLTLGTLLVIKKLQK